MSGHRPGTGSGRASSTATTGTAMATGHSITSPLCGRAVASSCGGAHRARARADNFPSWFEARNPKTASYSQKVHTDAMTPAGAVVTLLFTDIVGSTELLSALGDDAFEDVRRKHFRVLGEVVNAGGGSEVKKLGDGLMAVFPSAVEAVGCAMAIQRAVAR